MLILLPCTRSCCFSRKVYGPSGRLQVRQEEEVREREGRREGEALSCTRSTREAERDNVPVIAACFRFVCGLETTRTRRRRRRRRTTTTTTTTAATTTTTTTTAGPALYRLPDPIFSPAIQWSPPEQAYQTAVCRHAPKSRRIYTRTRCLGAR